MSRPAGPGVKIMRLTVGEERLTFVKTTAGTAAMHVPCPFHQETTSSLLLSWKRQCYYCFGCHVSGPLECLEG